MPARKLEHYVQMGIKAGAAAGMMEPSAVAEMIYMIASRGECVPLRLPLGSTAWKMSKAKFEGLLKEWDSVKELSGMGQSLWGWGEGEVKEERLRLCESRFIIWFILLFLSLDKH